MADLKLTPQEKNIVQYHRDNIAFNNVGTGPEGEPVTVYSTGVTMDSGPYKGKSALVPGYIQGKQYEDPDLIRDYFRTDINKGKYPIYNTPEEGDKRAKEIHKIMDQEVEAAEKAGRAPKSEQYKKGGKVEDKYRSQKLVKGFDGQKTSLTRVFNGTVVRGHGIETKGRTKGRIV
jgi:hypothetical protein